MTYAVMEGDVIANLVIATPEYALTKGWIPAPEGAAIGWYREGDRWIDPNPTVADSVAGSDSIA